MLCRTFTFSKLCDVDHLFITIVTWEADDDEIQVINKFMHKSNHGGLSELRFWNNSVNCQNRQGISNKFFAGGRLDKILHLFEV